ncbi:MAG: DNA polymerase III subunit gamma/tau [Flavobacteriaceae bacterium]|nr:DNA polymerase III subunit gamma/tau [Flavobacteriaceae bacterium]
MERFIVSALKYRPKKFEDVVGQEFVTRTLQNALDTNQMPKALLFCGPRGVGKTSCARILAKAINNSMALSDDDFSFNIFELDAASNNSVEDIRRLNEQVRIPPQTGTHKIYIIDEAHMLSTQAFNAFLKTLEEPPENVIFILATTEKNKIIPTILSRCQVYDFKRISVKHIVEFLTKIVIEKQLNYQEDALYLIAQKADGAMRDALSTLDRMISFTNGQLTTKLVSENLNILDTESYLEIINKIQSHNLSSLILQYNKLFFNGLDNHEFLLGLSQHFRNLLMIKNSNTAELLDFGKNIITLYQQQSQCMKVTWLIDCLELVHQYEIKFKNSHNKQVHVELCLLQLASLNYYEKKSLEIIPVESIKKQNQLEKNTIHQTNTQHSSQVVDLPQTDPSNNQISDKTEEAENPHETQKISSITNTSSNQPPKKASTLTENDTKTAELNVNPPFENAQNLDHKKAETVVNSKTSAFDALSQPKYRGKGQSLSIDYLNQFFADLKSEIEVESEKFSFKYLSMGKYDIGKKNQIIFKANSSFILGKFHALQSPLLKALNNYFENDSIHIASSIDDSPQNEKRMSKSEIVQEYFKINPVFKTLYDEFKLE